jgi:hypothetical protein
MAEVSAADMRSAFEDSNLMIHPDAVEKSVALCGEYRIDAEDLVNNWESFLLANEEIKVRSHNAPPARRLRLTPTNLYSRASSSRSRTFCNKILNTLALRRANASTTHNKHAARYTHLTH